MPIVKVVKGNLIGAKESVICQQSNCVTMMGHGLSLQISTKYPWADAYARRTPFTRNCTKTPSLIGTILVDNFEDKSVIHMFAQYLPGKPNVWGRAYRSVPKQNDGPSDRIRHFKACLNQLDELKLDVVAMPYFIGCGLAGGDWKVYEMMLNDCKTNIILYKL